jgi:hypothetical protein
MENLNYESKKVKNLTQLHRSVFCRPSNSYNMGAGFIFQVGHITIFNQLET